MTPEENVINHRMTVMRWDMGREDYTIERIPLDEVYRAPDGVRMSRARYRKVRTRLRPDEFYTTRVIGPAVIKKKCTHKDASEHHGCIHEPYTNRWLGLTMFIVKDDDPCSTETLAAHLEEAARVIGWKKDTKGIMQPVYPDIYLYGKWFYTDVYLY